MPHLPFPAAREPSCTLDTLFRLVDKFENGASSTKNQNPIMRILPSESEEKINL
jgi:hypothetical protein